MTIDHIGLTRLQEFIAVVNAVMNAVPYPVPPMPEDDDEWDGRLMPVQAFYLAYSRLPDPLQAVAARGYQLCEQVLTNQRDTAGTAQFALFVTFDDIMRRTGLAAEVLVPDHPGRGHLTVVRHPDDDAGDDERDILRREALRAMAAHAEVIAFPRAATAAPDAPEPDDDARASRRAGWPLALAAFVAGAVAVAAVFLLWPRAPGDNAAAAPAFAIDRSAQADDLTLIVSHGVEVEDDVDLHVHMVNAAATAREADITVSDGDEDRPVPPRELIPPRSTRHRVIKVRKPSPETTISISAGRATVKIPSFSEPLR